MKALVEEETETTFRVAEHLYVPKHEILSPDEAREVVKRYNARPEQFPYILSTDPVVTELKARPGDLIRITRKSETAGEFVYYRLVVER